MAFIKNQYSTKVALKPHYVWIKTDVVEGIIIEDTPPSFHVQNRIIVKKDTVWLEIESDYAITVLNTAPANTVPLGTYGDLDTTEIKLKGNELFILGPRDNDGYQFGALEKLYVRIDIKNNTIEIFKS